MTEYELLTGSKDTQKRSAERLAEKYLRLARNYRRAQAKMRPETAETDG